MKYLCLALISISFVIISYSCKKEACPDRSFQNQQLEIESHAYFTGQETNALIYIDSSGSEHRYDRVTNEDRLYTIIATDTCENDLNLVSFLSEYKLTRFSAPNETSIVFVQIVEFPDYKSPFSEDRVADILKMSIYNDSAPSPFIGRICIITSSKQGMWDQHAYNAEQYISYDSLSFGQKIFYDVWEQKNGISKMYYTKSEGVIAFTDRFGTALVLDRME